MLVLLFWFLAVVMVSGALAPAGAVARILAGTIYVLSLIPLGWASLSLQIRRWHDLGRSGWSIFISLIPLLGLVANVIFLGFVRGTAGPNKYGAPAADAGLPTNRSVSPPASPMAVPPPLAAPAPRRSGPSRRFFLIIAGVFALVVVLGGASWYFSSAQSLALRRQWLRATFGSSEDQLALAWRYRAGDGVPANLGQALRWFERAAKNGSAKAQYDLGVIYYYGIGSPPDPAKAQSFLEAAARQDYGPASTLLGLIASEDQSDSDRALTLWTTAANQGDPWAESLLGSAYLARRDAAEENLILALFWLEKARRDGAEPVGGMLQHVWATVADDRLEAVTAEVFRRLDSGSPAPLPPPKTEEAMTTSQPAQETPTAADEAEPPAGSLAADVLAQLKVTREYSDLAQRYDRKCQQDTNWADSEQGQAVADYLKGMRADAAATQVADDGSGGKVLQYSVAGTQMTDEGVRTADLDTDKDYRAFVAAAVAKNISVSARPIKVVEFLQAEDAADQPPPSHDGAEK